MMYMTPKTILVWKDIFGYCTFGKLLRWGILKNIEQACWIAWHVSILCWSEASIVVKFWRCFLYTRRHLFQDSLKMFHSVLPNTRPFSETRSASIGILCTGKLLKFLGMFWRCFLDVPHERFFSKESWRISHTSCISSEKLKLTNHWNKSLRQSIGILCTSEASLLLEML